MRPVLLVSLLLPMLPGQTFPLTGRDVPELRTFETAVRQIMEKWAIPGASLAIADQNRLIYARGLGWADREAGQPVQPLSRFRLASISKTIAGMTILKMAEEGRLNLDAPFQTYLPDLRPATSPAPDPRMARVTVRQLLQHTAGFDRPIDDDHVNYFNTASRLFGNAPITTDLMARYVMSQRLDFDPGAKFAYGNSAYTLLGRIAERLGGNKPFVEVAYDKILRPAGVTSVEIGGNLLSQRKADEVRYYDYPGAPLSTTAVAPGVTLPAPRPYNRRVDMADSYGGLIGTAVDLLRYLLALEGRRGPALLNNASIAAMTARSSLWPATGTFWGLTWRVTPVTGGVNWWHTGGASGTRNLMMRRHSGRSFVILMNSRPENEDQIITELIESFAATEQQVRTWPTHDLFADFSGPTLTANAETLTFAHSAGSNAPEPQTLQVNVSAGTSTVNVDTPTESWLRLDRLTATTPATFRVSVEPAGLAPGDYQAQLRLTAAGAINSPRLVRVTLRVTATPAFEAIRNSASRQPTTNVAPASRLALTAENIAAARAVGNGEADSLGGVTASWLDSAGTEHAGVLVEVGPNLAELVAPANLALGEATIRLLTHRGQVIESRIMVTAVSPGLFSAAGDGQGAALATVTRTSEDGTVLATEPAYTCADGSCQATPIDFGADTDRVELRLAITGTRSLTEAASYAVRVGEDISEVLTLQPSEQAGIDWLTVRLPRTLAGRTGEHQIVVTVAEAASNAVKVAVR